MRPSLLLLLFFVSGISYAIENPAETSPCPGLVSEYGYAQFEDALLVTDDVFTSVEDCQRVAAFYYATGNNTARILDVSSIASIVDATWQPVAEESPFLFMEALLHWFKNLGFENQTESLKDFLEEYMPSKESAEFFFTIMYWLIAAGTVGLVLREFYLAGLLRRPSFRKKKLKTGEKRILSELQWQQVITLPMREQIAALLRYSIQCLAALEVIPASKSYTNRELVSYLKKADASKAGMFLDQLKLSEPVLYGDQPVTDEALAVCRRSAEGMRGA